MTITAEAVQQYLDSQKEATERAAMTPEERTKEEQRAHWAKLNEEALERQGIAKHGVEGWAKLKAKRKAEEKEVEAHKDALEATKEAGMKEQARKIYVSEGGTRGRFDEAWPAIRRELLRRRTIERMTSPRRRSKLRM